MKQLYSDENFDALVNMISMQEENSDSLNKSKKEDRSNHCYEKDLSNPIVILYLEMQQQSRSWWCRHSDDLGKSAVAMTIPATKEESIRCNPSCQGYIN